METETIRVSACCKEWAVADYTDDPIHNDIKIAHYTCMKCEKDCRVEEVCYYCRGTGEVTTMEQVYPGEPHMADIGTQKCVCQLQDNDEYNDQD